MSAPRGLSEDLTWALRLVRRGMPRQEVVKTITRKHAKHGYHSLMYGELVKQRGFAAADGYAERTVTKAIRYAKEDPRVMDPHEARVRLAEIRAVVDVEPWPLELAGARRALEAAFVLAFERGRVAEMRLDLRTHAMRAGQSFAAIRTHRSELHDLGWLRRNPRDRAGRTSRFNFYVPEHIERPSGSCYVRRSPVLNHDAYRPRALGDAGWYVQHLISIDAELPDDALETLAVLQEHGLGIPLAEDELLWALDIAALSFGTLNTGHREGMRFFEERAERARRAEVIRCAELQDAS